MDHRIKKMPLALLALSCFFISSPAAKAADGEKIFNQGGVTITVRMLPDDKVMYKTFEVNADNQTAGEKVLRGTLVLRYWQYPEIKTDAGSCTVFMLLLPRCRTTRKFECRRTALSRGWTFEEIKVSD